MFTNRLDFSKLWDEVCSGNQKAYATLHRQLYPALFSYVRGIVRDEDLANDLLQDMFVKLWMKKTFIGPIGNVKSYFFTTIRSLALNHIRQSKLQNKKLENLAFADIQFSAEELNFEREEGLERTRTISLALEKLPERQREILYLRFYEGMDYDQIVTVTGIKYQSVLNHIHRAVQRLREDFRYESDLRVA